MADDHKSVPPIACPPAVPEIGQIEDLPLTASAALPRKAAHAPGIYLRAAAMFADDQHAAHRSLGLEAKPLQVGTSPSVRGVA
jgi:hypothetical protein